MDLSQLILAGKINDCTIGNGVSDIPGLLEITTQDGDIPALYECQTAGFHFQFTVLNGAIIGFDFDLSYYRDDVFALKTEAAALHFSSDTHLDAFCSFLYEQQIMCEVQQHEFESIHITILQSGTKLYFNDATKALFRISLFSPV